MIEPEYGPGVDKAKAKKLQTGLNSLNKTSPVNQLCWWFLEQPKHWCGTPGYEKFVASIQTKEIYAVGWKKHMDPYTITPITEIKPSHDTAIIFREGKCLKCSATVRSEIGRVVLINQRPALAKVLSDVSNSKSVD